MLRGHIRAIELFASPRTAEFGTVARLRLLLSAALLAMVVVACGDGGTAAQSPSATAAPPPPRAALPTDFVFCIDNSRSIAPAERTLLRETVMLLADLADSGDRVAVLTFDSDARVSTAVRVQNDDDRRAFKKAVEVKVDFQGTRSDIRSCVKLLASKQDELFRAPGASVRVPIVLSDGKLEPADRKLRAAFDELRETVRGPLAETGLYAVVLGDKSSRDELLREDDRPVNGAVLMRDYVARSPDRYFHASRLDQLLPIVVGILNRSKGIGTLGEEGAREFRVDDTVEWMSFIVRKRSVDKGRPIAESGEIEIVAPAGVSATPITLANSREVLGDALYWSQYQYFDLIVVRRPLPGNWAIRLSSGETPEVLSKVVSPVALRVERRPFYFLNESDLIGVSLQDRKTGEALAGDYVVQARVAAGTPLKESQAHTALAVDEAAHQYLLEMPGGVARALGRELGPGLVEMEIVAQRRSAPGGTDVDPWFIRRSGPFTVELREPFVDLLAPDGIFTRMPFRAISLLFGADLHSDKAGAPAFETPPALTLELQRQAADGTAYEPLFQEPIAGASEATTLRYRLERELAADGNYRYRYRLAGTVSAGRFVFASPWYPLRVVLGWYYVLAAGVLLLAIIGVTSSVLARLRGQIVVRTGGREYAQTVAPVRVVDSARVSAANARMRFGNVRFRLEARRWFFVHKRIRLTLLAGEALFDNAPLAVGRAVAYRPGDKTLSLRDGAATVSVNIRLRVG